MIAVAKLAWKSLINRKATAILTIMTVAISVILLLGDFGKTRGFVRWWLLY